MTADEINGIDQVDELLAIEADEDTYINDDAPAVTSSRGV
jgi:hypothetical protein